MQSVSAHWESTTGESDGDRWPRDVAAEAVASWQGGMVELSSMDVEVADSFALADSRTAPKLIAQLLAIPTHLPALVLPSYAICKYFDFDLLDPEDEHMPVVFAVVLPLSMALLVADEINAFCVFYNEWVRSLLERPAVTHEPSLQIAKYEEAAALRADRFPTTLCIVCLENFDPDDEVAW
eukprot:CAMPEP_0117532134 /NCGR_PEP_ID=MMETSP0784-20121206/39213_1 /TAXON_ID=39447 /ORGANISM="" /LENGTH=180 /DNA_ID=CAMNT_0005328521 /DNA_START=36 /DNA_END=575 /DNA_ORIENTATION=-